MGDVPDRPRSRRRRPTRAFDRAAYDRAARRQALDRELSPTPVPARITIALNLRGLWGDQVDRDLGVWEPPDGWDGPTWEPGTAVDRWEDGTLVPTREQIMVLANLTGWPWRFFYLPVTTWPNRVFMCERRRGGRGLTIVRSDVDDNGVLHFHEPPDGTPDSPDRRDRLRDEDEPGDDAIVSDGPARATPRARTGGPARGTRRPARAQRSSGTVKTHAFELDPDTPGVCKMCGFVRKNRRHGS